MNDHEPPTSTSQRTRQWSRAFPEFDRLIALEPGARDRALALLRVEQPDLYRDVLTLLAADRAAESGEFLTRETTSGSRPSADARDLAADDRVGLYRLQRRLGLGGMGEVWLARREDGLFAMPVALKLPHRHRVAFSMRERFIREGRILSQMSHPNVAQLFDAGVTTDGQLYLAMEYVDGEPIDRWCDSRQLDIDARLVLLLQVCAALSHAHAHLVVHRDVKPGNILVTASGQAKLLDFGIAKLVDEETGGVATELTRLGGGAFTPEYAAPEQIARGAITTATDVYSLGVLMYGLLSGRRPYARDGRPGYELERAVIEDAPPPMSRARTAVAGSISPDAIARCRSSTPVRLQGRLRGDLDAIIGKALKKHPAERYPTVQALAEDLRRHQANEPVLARPDSIAYRLRKTVRRHRWGFAAGAAVLAALFLGLIAALWQTHVAVVARQQQTVQRQQAEHLIDFMLGDLKERLKQVGRLDALDATIAEAQRYLGTADLKSADDDQLFERSTALTDIEEVQFASGQLPLAIASAQGAVAAAREYRQRLPGRNADALLARALNGLTEAAVESGSFEIAGPASLEGTALARDLYQHAPDTAATLLLAELNAGRAAVDAYGPTLDVKAADRGWSTCSDLINPLLQAGDAPSLWWRDELSCEVQRAILLFNSVRYQDSIEVFRHVLSASTTARQRFAQDLALQHVLQAALGNATTAFTRMGALGDAQAASRDGVAIGRRLVSFEPDNTEWLRELASALKAQVELGMKSADWPQANAAAEEALTLYDRALAHDPGSTNIRREILNLRGLRARLAMHDIPPHPERALFELNQGLAQLRPDDSQGLQFDALLLRLLQWRYALGVDAATVESARSATASLVDRLTVLLGDEVGELDRSLARNCLPEGRCCRWRPAGAAPDCGQGCGRPGSAGRPGIPRRGVCPGFAPGPAVPGTSRSDPLERRRRPAVPSPTS